VNAKGWGEGRKIVYSRVGRENTGVKDATVADGTEKRRGNVL